MTSASGPPAADSSASAAADAARVARAEAEAAVARAEQAEAAAAAAAQAESAAAPPAADDSGTVAAVRAGYAFDGAVVEIGALVDGGEPRADVGVRIPLAMMNRHGLVAGATGTGKTKTLQVLAEQVAAQGVPVFAADVKGDLSGIAAAGTSSDKLLERTRGIGQEWTPTASSTELLSLGGLGTGVPVRATVSAFGPLLLSKVLGLNDTQESSLGLVFHYADQAGLPLLDLADLRQVLTYLVSDEGKPELKELGGLSSATAGVILRELVTFADQGADAFFGEPELDTADLLRVDADGRGVVSLLELSHVQDKPALFSTFLMWLLADLYADLPEVGDTDKPRLVFFFDEAHLLFRDASKDFLDQVAQTVRLIRSKGVGIFFVTQTPKDVPSEVLAQLGSRLQHQLRAHTPEDAKSLKATVSTYPTSEYDLAEVLTALPTGEAVVTVMSDRGAPTPVAWTRLRAPQGSMDPLPAADVEALVAASPLTPRYGQAVDRESAREMLLARLEAGAEAAAAEKRAEADASDAARADDRTDRLRREAERATRGSGSRPRRTSTRQTPAEKMLGEAGRTLAREIVRGIFRTGRRR
ncbi:helicase HerA-like domain-containing protein [Solicola sp. PLA-1-18]|uniref:helicase HerA-like domain-containing protein n=1 Tax=Solicola sp. PLA-1-18 TaxID=3380532 RepID=UPI003B7C111F